MDILGANCNGGSSSERVEGRMENFIKDSPWSGHKIQKQCGHSSKFADIWFNGPTNRFSSLKIYCHCDIKIWFHIWMCRQKHHDHHHWVDFEATIFSSSYFLTKKKNFFDSPVVSTFVPIPLSFKTQEKEIKFYIRQLFLYIFGPNENIKTKEKLTIDTMKSS